VIYLFTVASPARSATKWYSELFTTDRSFCYHQLTGLLEPWPTAVALQEWLEAQVEDHDFEQAQRRMLLQGFPHYFARLWERALFGQYVVGNSDGMADTFAPGLWLIWPDMRFLFSFRNGINTVNSSLVWQSHVPSWMRSAQERRFGTSSYFEQCCYTWRDSVERLRKHQAWLTERGAQLVETRLEAVTSDEDELHRVWDFLIGYWDEYAERNRQLMKSIVNARVNTEGIVPPEEIWERWEPEHRSAFIQICGSAQEALGYALPSRKQASARSSSTSA
jgi:hypothetical protein